MCRLTIISRYTSAPSEKVVHSSMSGLTDRLRVLWAHLRSGLWSSTRNCIHIAHMCCTDKPLY